MDSAAAGEAVDAVDAVSVEDEVEDEGEAGAGIDAFGSAAGSAAEVVSGSGSLG